MCGIVGYIGNKQAYSILIKGLHRLEYRGYDSAGIALINGNGKLNVYKNKGKVSQLEESVAGKDVSGTIGIAHTRWATHGEPSNINAHPHYSGFGTLALIHNGIIENYALLKSGLIEKGCTFHSDTDTEVLVNLIEYVRNSGNHSFFKAVQLALNQVVGAYAIAVLDKDDPDTIIVARKSSPLVIGVSDEENEYFFASDASPIVEYTNSVIYLQDNEIAIISRKEPLKVIDLKNEEKTPEISHLELSISQLERGNYPHFMLKEIFEQPQTIADCMKGRVNTEGTNVVLSGIIDNKARFLSARRIIIVACGTSWHSALIGEHLIENFCRIPVEVEYASEFRYRDPIIYPDDIVIAISQSGETADTFAAVELSKQKGAFIYGICNVVGSSIARITDSGSYIHVGPEIGVASTKAFTGQVTVLAMLAMTLAKEKGTINPNELTSVIKAFKKIPEQMELLLQNNDQIQEMAKIFTYARNFIYLGRGYSYPSALEGALKLKEISYIHAEGYPAAEMKHGPIALIDSEMPVVVIATNTKLYEKVINNIQAVKARGGRVIAVVTEGDEEVKKLADYYISVPKTMECFGPLLAAIPLQLLAYHIAVYKGKDVDQPRHLAKSVTVE
ncbi:MAG: glutamine--fructose-6-phosphate transaminase (isomerizing) [Bacteroidales bacterium]|nr:glutamine--fructose-6-phosphate transaminase (isomerizing) [Bacteroidales bacterium]